MNRNAIFMLAFALATCLGTESRAEEALPLTNVGEMPVMSMIDACNKVFEIGEHHQSRRRIVSALDSYSWVIVNLPFAPITSAMNRKNSEAFVSALAAADRKDIAVFGDQRAIRYLARILSDDTLPDSIKKHAQNVKDYLTKSIKAVEAKESTTQKEGGQAAPSDGDKPKK